jgi:hypothetical protein
MIGNVQKLTDFLDAHKNITFKFSSSSNRSAWAMLSPRFTVILTAGCDRPSGLDNSVALNPNLQTAQ